jgi:heptosyltransferase I
VKILIVRLGALGDIVHALPAVTALRAAHPDATVDWLVEAQHARLLDLFPIADRVIPIDPRAWAATVATVRQLRARRYDAALDFQGLLKSALFARLSGARRVIGFAKTALREPIAAVAYTETVDPGDHGHVIRKNLALLRAVGVETDAIALPALRVRSDLVADVEAADGPRFGILNPGAGWPNKQWPPERFGALAAAVHGAAGLPWVVVWGPGEEPLARRVEEASEGTAMLAPETSLADLTALIARASIVVAGDTGPIHLAAAVGTPVVGLYGPTSPARNGPWKVADVTVSRFESCRCHHKRQCTEATRCLDTIGVDEVVTAVIMRLTRAAAEPAPSS